MSLLIALILAILSRFGPLLSPVPAAVAPPKHAFLQCLGWG